MSSATLKPEQNHERESMDNRADRTHQMIVDTLEIFSRHLRSHE